MIDYKPQSIICLENNKLSLKEISKQMDGKVSPATLWRHKNQCWRALKAARYKTDNFSPRKHKVVQVWGELLLREGVPIQKSELTENDYLVTIEIAAPMKPRVLTTDDSQKLETPTTVPQPVLPAYLFALFKPEKKIPAKPL